MKQNKMKQNKIGEGSELTQKVLPTLQANGAGHLKLLQ